MTLSSVPIGSLRTIMCFCILATLLLGRTQAQSQAAANGAFNPKSAPYNERILARVFGNVGGWWSFMSENDKAAFLDGYQFAMAQALSQSTITCKILRDSVKPSSDQHTFMDHFAAVLEICDSVKDFSGFEKVTTRDLDGFYSDPLNQPILLEWAMPYLRDKATGRKTAGQLLDALQAEQKDIHDCSKYPNLCKLGVKELQPSQ